MLNGMNVPQVICSSCGQAITDAKKAAVVFENFSAEGQSVDLSYVHKNFVGNNCLSQAEQKIRATGKQSGWEELSTHMAYIVSNVGLNEKDIAAVLSRPDR